MTRWVYCDTSAMAKRYVNEPGRAQFAKLLVRRRVVSSVLLPLELHAAFCRRERDGTLPAMAVPRLIQRVAADREYWTLVETTAEVLCDAETYVDLDHLRTLDAVHVASARLFQTRLGEPVTFASGDRRQLAAARRRDLVVAQI